MLKLRTLNKLESNTLKVIIEFMLNIQLFFFVDMTLISIKFEGH